MKLALPILLALVLFLSVAAFAAYEKYSWQDGTTAPIECVQKCRDKGVLVESSVKNGIHYLSDACKSVCYSNTLQAADQTAMGSSPNGQGAPATANKNSDAADSSKGENTEGAPASPPGASGSANGGMPSFVQNSSATIGARIENQTGAKNTSREMEQAKNRSLEQQMENNTGEENYNGSNPAENKSFGQYIASRQRIDISQIARNMSFEITPGTIGVHGQQVSAVAKTVSLMARNRTILLIQKSGGVEISDSNASVLVGNVSVSPSGEISVEGQPLGALPSRISQEAKGSLENLSLSQRNGVLTYTAKTLRNGKFLGLFEMHYEVDSEYSAQDGSLMGSNKPIWSLLVFE